MVFGSLFKSPLTFTPSGQFRAGFTDFTAWDEELVRITNK